MRPQLTLWPVEKTCNRCGQTKPLAAFPARGAVCKKCVVKRVKAWQHQNLERVREYSRKRRRLEALGLKDKATVNTARKRETSRAYARKNRAKLRAKHKAWRDKNASHVRAYGRQQARLRQLGRDAAAKEYGNTLLADPCSYCGMPAGTLDHIVPLSAGGGNEWNNLTAACGHCNRSKKNAPLIIFLQRRDDPATGTTGAV